MEPGRGSLAVAKLYSAICPEKKTKKGAIAAQYLTLTYQASINSRFHKPTMTAMTYKSYSVLYFIYAAATKYYSVVFSGRKHI